MKTALLAVSLLATAAIPAAGQQQQAPRNDAASLVRGGFTEVADWVTRAADLVPAERYDYRPTEAVRTFGQLVGHLADSYNYFCARGAGRTVEWADPVEKGRQDKATLVQALRQATAACNSAYGAANGQLQPLMANVGHTNLHYGNIITYLRMMGLTPPSS